MIVDSHEENSEYFIPMLREEGIDVEIQTLPVGDLMYVGEIDTILVERKTTKDFVASVLDQRLFKQCIDLANVRDQEGIKVFILLEGHQTVEKALESLTPEIQEMWRSRYTRKVSGEAIIAAMITVPYSFNIPLIPSEKPSVTAKIIKRIALLAGKSRTDRKHVYALRQAVGKKRNMDEKMRYVLEGFPGISGNRADLILKQFSTLRDALGDISNWKNIKGIGNKTVDEAISLMTHKYKQKQTKLM